MGKPFFITCEICSSAGSIPLIIREISSKADMEIAPYSKGIDEVFISVNCFTDEDIADGLGKPRKYLSYQKRFADIRLPIPYDAFIRANRETKYRMVVKNIVESIRIIGERCRKSGRAEFDSEAFIRDFLQKLEIEPKSLEGIVGVIPDEQYRQIINDTPEHALS